MDIDSSLGQHEDPTLNPWSGPMVIDNDPIQQTAGQRSRGKSSRHHPQEDDSDSEPGAGYETPKGKSGTEAVRIFDLAAMHVNSVPGVDTVQCLHSRSGLLIRAARAALEFRRHTCRGYVKESRACSKTIKSGTLICTYTTFRP